MQEGKVTYPFLTPNTTKHTRYVTPHHIVHANIKTQTQIHNAEQNYRVRRVVLSGGTKNYYQVGC